jgi:hypothetical protein
MMEVIGYSEVIATENKRFLAKKNSAIQWSESDFQKPLFSALISILGHLEIKCVGGRL